MRSPRGTLLALSGSDVPDGPQMLVYSCEDCACPVSRAGLGERDVPDPCSSGPLVRARGAVAVDLDDEHVALFGPSGNGGVVVLNRAAHALLDDLEEPTGLVGLANAGYDRREAAG